MDNVSKEQYVYQVFQNISKGYDRANQRISLGFQQSFKRMLLSRLKKNTPYGGKVLDVCCGTGDITLFLADRRQDLEVTGLDFSPAMLSKARLRNVKKRRKNVHFRQGNALDLPFEDNSFEAVSISFGLRNTTDYSRVLQEMKRVTKPGGYIYCLDSFVPECVLIKPFYTIYFRYIMPLLGGGIHHRKEYLWLYHSTKHFLSGKELKKLFVRVGIRKVQDKNKMFGACVLVWGRK